MKYTIFNEKVSSKQRDVQFAIEDARGKVAVQVHLFLIRNAGKPYSREPSGKTAWIDEHEIDAKARALLSQK